MKGKNVVCMLCIGIVLIVILCVHVGGREKGNTPYLGRDEEAIKKHMASCSDDVDSLKASGALVVFEGYLYGREYWEDFIEKVENKEKCNIDIVTFYPDSIVVRSYFEYDGTNFYQLIDYTRMPENTAGLSGYQRHMYTDLNCIDIPEKEYETLNIPVMEDNVKLAIFSNKKIRTYDDFVEYYGSDDREYFFWFKLWTREKG